MKRTHRQIKKRVLSAIVIAALGVGLCQNQVITYASAKTSAQREKNNAESELDEVQDSISAIESEQSALQREIDALDAELVDLLMNMSILEGELSDKEEELVQVQADLVEAQETEEAQYDAMTKRIRFMYQKGDTALINAILESKSLADVINQVQYYSDVYSYDQDMQAQLEETRKQVAALEKQVIDEKSELEEMQAAYQQQEGELETMMAEKSSELDNFDAQLASARALAEEYEETIARQNEIIRAEEAREAAAAEAARAAAQAAASTQNNTTSTSGSGGSTSSGGSSTPAASTTDTSKNPSYTTGVSGSDVVSYAMQFVGNRYVWGGTNPNTGADCSGFTQYVFAHFGISIPRTSGSQRSAGKEVSYANAQPGDLICYSGHVAIYIGGGKIVHAQSTATGIVSGTSATYRTIVSVRRVL